MVPNSQLSLMGWVGDSFWKPQMVIDGALAGPGLHFILTFIILISL